MILLKDLLYQYINQTKCLQLEKGYGVDRINPKWFEKQIDIIFAKQGADLANALSQESMFYYFPILNNGKMFLQSEIRVNAFHGTSYKFLKNTIQSQNDRHRELSCAFKSYYGLGGWWAKGVLLYLEGNYLVGCYADLSSIPDETGRRWVLAGRIFDKDKMGAWVNFRKSFIKNNIGKTINKENESKIIQDFFQKVREFVKKQKPFLIRNKENVQNLFIDSDDYSNGELILNKYKIKHALINENDYYVNEIEKILQQYNIKYSIINGDALQNYTKKFKVGVIQ